MNTPPCSRVVPLEGELAALVQDDRSGQTQRHRLSRGGDRQLNRALHTVALRVVDNGTAT